MYQTIYNTLYRQRQALQLLEGLLHEEYDLLRARNTTDVVALEFSIHELIRQLAVEKTFVIRLLGGGKVRDYAALLGEEQGQAILAVFQEIDTFEQRCSQQASRNAQLSLALLDQSQRTLDELQTQLVPPTPKIYGRRGMMGTYRPEASLISGRL